MFQVFSKISFDKEFVGSLVQKLVLNFPPISLKTEGKSASVNRVTRLLERTYLAANQYQAEQSMGIVRRAMFANAFRWALISAGYTTDFAKVATEGLVVALMKSRKNEAVK